MLDLVVLCTSGPCRISTNRWKFRSRKKASPLLHPMDELEGIRNQFASTWVVSLQEEEKTPYDNISDRLPWERSFQISLSDEKRSLEAIMRSAILKLPDSNDLMLSFGNLTWVRRDSIEKLIDCYNKNSFFEMLQLHFGGQPGAPLIIRSSAKKSVIEASDGQHSCFYLRSKLKNRYLAIEVDDPGVVKDIQRYVTSIHH